MKIRIKELEDIIDLADESYYNLSKSIISDEEYDIFRDELSELDPKNKRNKRIGKKEKKSTKFKKVEHEMSMCSLSKVNLSQELIDWSIKKNIKLVSLEEKLDGSSLELIYDKGTLIHALTAHDGITGQDVYENVMLIPGFPKEVSTDRRFSVRAEVVLEISKFNKINKQRKKDGLELFSNPRNSATGIVKREKDKKYIDQLSLQFYDFECKEWDEIKTEEKKIGLLKFLKFPTTFHKVCSISEVIEIYHEYVKDKRSSLDYLIDGLVIKDNNIHTEDNNKSVPDYQKAFKFPAVQKRSTLRDIVWNMGITGIYTPVGIYDPVNIDGVICKRATLCNIELIEEIDLEIGDDILISRRNDVIPKIEKVIKKGDIRKGTKKPEKCYICNSDLIRDGKLLKCLNENCQGSRYGKLKKWINILDIKSLGGLTLLKLMENCNVREIPDLYDLKIDDIKTIEGLGKRSAQKFLDQLHSKKNILLHKFIAGLSISNCNSRTSELLVEYIKVGTSLDKLDFIMNMSIKEFSAIPGIAEKTATMIRVDLDKRLPIMKKLLKIVSLILPEKKGNKFSKLSFCITGKLSKSRKEIEKLIKSNGGILKGISKGLSYLITNTPDSSSSKNKKSDKLEIKKITEKEFLNLLL